jgi:hypothetical protein
MAEVVNINDLLDGHVGLDLECLDRIYLNAYVPNLPVGGQVVRFLTEHLGNPIPSPVLFQRIGERFRREVARFAECNHIPLLHLKRPDRTRWDDRKLDHVALPGAGNPARGGGDRGRSGVPTGVRRVDCSTKPGVACFDFPRSTGGSASTPSSLSWTPTSAPASSSCAATSRLRASSG